MLFGILRFNRICKRLARGDASAPEMQQTLKQFLHKHAFGAAFKNWLVWCSRMTGLMLQDAGSCAAALLLTLTHVPAAHAGLRLELPLQPNA